MLVGVIADDFTGASDIANTLAKGVEPEGGLQTAQFSGVPSGVVDPEIEAGVISLKSRSAPVDHAVADSLAVLQWLLEQGCEQIIFKYCSTFDSTPDGNIGPVAEALAKALDVGQVIVCPAFPTAGRTVYQGHLFVHDALLSQSGMQHHPLTPMTDPDIRRWLRMQTSGTVGHIPLATILDGVDESRKHVSNSVETFIVADAVTDSDLMTLGEALSDAKLITGGSGIALGLPRNFIRRNKTRTSRNSDVLVAGPEAILAGSCSGATRGQVELHARQYPVMEIDVPSVMEGRIDAQTLLEFYNSNAGKHPLAYSSGTPEQVEKIQLQFGREAVAEKLDSLFAETARMLVRNGYRRIVVAGGETSGAVAQAITSELKTPAMKIGAEIDPGVPVLTLGTENPVALALKSGNFGAPDFFSKAISIMGTGDE